MVSAFGVVVTLTAAAMDMDEPEQEVFRPLPPPPPLPKLRRRRAWRATSASLPAPPRKTMRLEPDDVGNGVEEPIQEVEEVVEQRAEEASTSPEIRQTSVDEEEERREEQRSGLNRSQRILYCASFLCHFGIPASVTPFLDDLASIMSDRAAPRGPISNEIDLFIRAMWAKYDYRTRYFCCECDGSLPDMRSRCSNAGCRLRGLALKRGKATKRVTIHTVSILPQLQTVLKRVLDELIEVHRRIHVDGCNTLRTEISYFPAYEADIETFLEFLSKEIRVVLTLNFDGVVFKKLTRSQAWPIYIRLEGLPYLMKNHASNMLIAGVMFLRKTPTETLLKELFSVLKEELGVLEGGIDIEAGTTVWKCFPVIKNGVIDFGGLHTIYKSPRWQSHQGCHLCVATGERIERTFCWYIPLAPLFDRRTHHSIIRDAAAHQNGLQGTTQMMDLLTMERCRVDALHAISEGVTCDLFRELFGSRNRVPELKMNRESILLLRACLESTRNITYANKFVLGMQDLSRCTASEKDAVASVAFPIIAAKLLCDPIGCAAVLSYWSLTQALQNCERWNSETIGETKDLALAMKRLWSRLSKQLFTLKLHCLIDHAIMQDLEYAGTPYQWSAAPFERMHRVLQIRHTQSATNCEELLLKNFLLNREFGYKMDVDTPTTNNQSCARLSSAMSNRGRANRFPVSCSLSYGWYIPSNSEIDPLNLSDQHAAEIDEFLRRGYTLSSRLCSSSSVFTSNHYWRRSTDTRSDIVFLNANGVPVFGSVVLFAYDPAIGHCVVLLESFLTEDPFDDLFRAVSRSEHAACEEASRALILSCAANKYFKKFAGTLLAVFDISAIASPALLASIANEMFVLRV